MRVYVRIALKVKYKTTDRVGENEMAFMHMKKPILQYRQNDSCSLTCLQ